MSAIVEFSTVEEAKEALKSNTPVLNDRFIEVNKKLELIRQRRLAQLMELKNKRTGIQRYHDLLVQYALLWERSKDEARLPHEDRLRSVSQKIFHDVKDVYHLVRSGVEKIEDSEGEKAGDGTTETTTNAGSSSTEAVPASNMLDNTERAKAEVLSILDNVREAVRSTSVFEEIDKTATELQGVRGVSIENGEASIIFEKHWQTKRPITMGIPVNGKVGFEE